MHWRYCSPPTKPSNIAAIDAISIKKSCHFEKKNHWLVIKKDNSHVVRDENFVKMMTLSLQWEASFFCRIMVRTEAIWYETLFDSARTLLLALSVGHMTGTFCFPANQYCRSWFHYKSIKILMAKLFSHLYHLLLNNYFDNTKGYAWELLKNFVMKRIKSYGKGKEDLNIWYEVHELLSETNLAPMAAILITVATRMWCMGWLLYSKTITQSGYGGSGTVNGVWDMASNWLAPSFCDWLV